MVQPILELVCTIKTHLLMKNAIYFTVQIACTLEHNTNDPNH